VKRPQTSVQCVSTLPTNVEYNTRTYALLVFLHQTAPTTGTANFTAKLWYDILNIMPHQTSTQHTLHKWEKAVEPLPLSLINGKLLLPQQISQQMYAMSITVTCSNKIKGILYTGIVTGGNVTGALVPHKECDTAVAQLLRYCATSWKVAGSIPGGVIGIFHWQIPSCRCGPGIDSVFNRNEYHEYFLGGKGGRYVALTNLPPSCADCLEIWESSTSWNPQGL
jgi:hypothetical protein